MTIQTLLILVMVGLYAYLVFHETVDRALWRLVDYEHESIAQLEWRKELILHAAFYGAAVAGFLGFQHDSMWTKAFAAVWFIAGLKLSRILTDRIHELEALEKSEHWRKLAGMIRSVTRSEVERRFPAETNGA